eukprot:5848896-Pleurochrysis_carterae.AAC.1
MLAARHHTPQETRHTSRSRAHTAAQVDTVHIVAARALYATTRWTTHAPVSPPFAASIRAMPCTRDHTGPVNARSRVASIFERVCVFMHRRGEEL